jgi:hypothetical protein
MLNQNSLFELPDEAKTAIIDILEKWLKWVSLVVVLVSL